MPRSPASAPPPCGWQIVRSEGLHFAFVRIDEREHRALDEKLAAIREENSVLIARAVKIGAQISAEFERLVSSGRITFDDLFDNNYVPIEGTDPVQVSTKFLPLLERVLPPIQNPFYDTNPNMTLCSAIDRNGYIPVHRPKHSQPQRARRAALERAQCPQPAHL